MKKYIFAGPFLALAVWAVLSLILQSILLPSPLKVVENLIYLLYSGSIFVDLFRTMLRWFAGLLLGLVCGIPLGILMGYSDKIYSSLEILLDFFRSLPSIVLYPLFLLFLGLGDMPKIFIGMWASLLYVTINTIYGVKYSRKSRLNVARVLRASRLQTFTKIIFPGALPDIVAGIRVSLSIGLIVIISAEMILGGNFGLGRRLLDASLLYNMSETYAIVIIVGLMGYFSNKLLVYAEGKIIHWRGK